MLNSRGEPMDKESRRGRRDLGAKNPGGPTAMFLKQEQPRLWPLFQPRPPLKFIGTVTKKKCLPLTGIAAFMEKFEAATSKPAPARVCQETILERKERRQKEKAAAHKKLLEPKIAAYREKQKRFSELRDSAKAKATAEAAAKIAAAVGGSGDGAAAAAASDTGDGDGAEGGTGLPPYMTVDPFCTLFAARLPFDTTESRLRRVFSKWGPVKKVHLVTHRDGAPRGMAFIEFESEKDMRAAYDRADGMKLGRNLDGKDMRILVDVERGRTVRDWLPRRLGGGLGGTRRGSVRVNDRSSGRAGAERERLGLGIASYRGSASPRGGYGGYSRGGYDRRGFDRPRTYDHRDRDRDRRDRDRDRDRDRTRDRDRRSHSARDDRKDRDRRSHRDDDRKRSRH